MQRVIHVFSFSVTYEIALRKLDLYNLVFGPDRSSFFLANKEGILGSIGLTALYLLYVELGRIILPKIKSNESILKDVTGLCLLFWLLVIFLHSIGIEPSRRLSNLGYVVWIAAMAMSFLLFCTIGEIARVRMRVSQPRLINDLNRTMLPGNRELCQRDSLRVQSITSFSVFAREHLHRISQFLHRNS